MTAALQDCCFRTGSSLVSFEAARQAAAASVRPHGRAEEVPLMVASGRILTKPVEAPFPLPPFDQAAMDGYAVCLSGKHGLPLVLPVDGRSDAGDVPVRLAAGTARRVMTGAVLPEGADTVVMQEQTMRRDDLVQFGPDVRQGTHIRRAGEDIGHGAVALPAGKMIGWPEIALLSALGVGSVSVSEPVKIAVLTTGSELCGAGEPLLPGTIHDSNGPMLAALLASPNVHVTSATAGDDLAAIARMLESLVDSTDLLVVTAGMSTGEKDHVRDAVMRAGGYLDLVKVAMKPGKPLALGRLRGTPFIGLPGNPQAAAFSALAFVRPMIETLLGAAGADRLTAATAFSHPCKPDRTELLPVRLSIENGCLTAHRSGPDGSHRIMPMVSADAIAVLPPAETVMEAGHAVEILPFDQPLFRRAAG